MKKKVTVFLIGEMHTDPVPIYCLRKFLNTLIQAKIPLKLAGEFEVDKSLAEMKAWFASVIPTNNKIMQEPLMKPFVTSKGKRQYVHNSHDARYTLSRVYRKPGDSKVMNEFFLYLLQQERMKEALALFEIIETYRISFTGIERPKAVTEALIQKYGKTNAASLDKANRDEQENHMFGQIMSECIYPLLTHLSIYENNDFGVVAVYLGAAHVVGVMDRIKSICFEDDVSIEVVPFGLFSDNNFNEVQRSGPSSGFSLPSQMIKIDESSDGMFDIRSFVEFLQPNLPEVLFPKKTANNSFAQCLAKWLPWAEITTHCFLVPEVVDVSAKATNPHQHKYLTQFFKPISKYVTSDPAKNVVTIKDVNVHTSEMHQFICSRDNLERARNAIRFVKWSCPIGAATNELDIEKTKSIDLSVPWARTSVALLRNANKEFFKALYDEVDACGIAACEWTEQMMQLRRLPEPKISNVDNPLPSLLQVFNEEMKYGKVLLEESAKLYTEHNILLYIIHKTAELAYERKCGNCGEQAVLAFVYLLKLNVAPIELFQVENGDHLFVVIGRAKDSDPQNIATWRNAVICDPWSNFFCYAQDLTEKQKKELLGEKPNAYPKVFLRQVTAIYIDSHNKKTDIPVLALTLRDVYKKLIEITLRLKIPNSQNYIKTVCEKMNIEDKSTAIFRLNAYHRINDLEAQRYDRELRRITKESANDVNTFFTTVTKPPKLADALQHEIKTFKF